MNERQKLEAKLAVAKYAESKGMTVVRDYGNWIAVAFVDNDTDIEHITKAIETSVKKKEKYGTTTNTANNRISGAKAVSQLYIRETSAI